MPHDDTDPLSLDLSADEFRRLGYRMIDRMAEALAVERREPVLRPLAGPEMRRLFDEPLPRAGQPADEVLDLLGGDLLRYSRRNGHPRFFAYVCGSADPIGALADAYASALNQIVTSWRSAPAATEIERLVVRWLDEMVGFEGGGHGLLVSGGSAANAHGVACALARAGGAEGVSRERMTVYLSREGHVSMRKAAVGFGIPPEQVRTVGVDGERRLIVAELDRLLAEDLDADRVPACVGASAGTANTGAIDPLNEVADLCRRHGVWFHVDGAYGAPAALLDDYAHLRQGFARADSLSLDPHKWLFAPLDVGCVLVRDAAASGRAFTHSTEYIAVTQTDPIERWAFFDHGPETSRRLRALKVWMILKVRGADRLAQVIERNVRLREHLDRRVAGHPRLEPLGSELSISCFRYHPEGPCDGERLNGLNRQILETLVREGRVYLSPTTLEGRYALRVCIVNFRTTERDVDLLIDEVLRLGGELE